MAYPIVSTIIQTPQSQVHTQYQEVVEKADGEELATARAEAEAYNELLASGAAAAELDALDYDSLLNLAGNGIMGYIEIPAIDVLLPIYHGVGEDSLERGAGHMPSTSLPIGGRGTHAVISAHSGMATARMFTDLEQLEAGDVFYLHVLNEALSYEVDQILVVKPYQIDALKIDREQDYVTLITCTPYGVNSHRLLVRGHRIEQEAEENVSNEIASPANGTEAIYLDGQVLGGHTGWLDSFPDCVSGLAGYHAACKKASREETAMNRKRIILRFLCAALLLSGLGLLLYPSVNAWLEKRKIGQHVEAFRIQ